MAAGTLLGALPAPTAAAQAATTRLWCGAVTPTSARVRGTVDPPSAAPRLAVADNPELSGLVYLQPEAATGGTVSFTVGDLSPDTSYWFAPEVDGALDTTVTGTFRTHPPLGEPAAFTFAAASCAGHRQPGGVSDSPVFDAIREHPLRPLFFAHLGDLHYRDIAEAAIAPFRQGYDDVLAQPRQHHLYRTVPIQYVWDDHDYGPNDSDRTAPGRMYAAAAYRERVPHYPLAADRPDAAIYHHFQVGRVLFVATDLRFDRDPNGDPQGPDKSMLGAAQKAWLANLLATSDAAALVWLNTCQWMGTSADSWSSFTHERDELVRMFGDHGWLERMCVISGDRHALAIDTGTGNTWGGFPVFQFAALDGDWSEAEHQYDTGPSSPGTDRYGTLTIADDGTNVEITGTGWIMSEPWRSHTFTV